MKRSIGTSVSLLFAFFILTSIGFAQAGGGGDPIPPHKMAVAGSNQASIVLDGTLVVNNFGVSLDSKVSFVRNVARSLLQADQISLIYRTEAGGPSVNKLSDGETAVVEVRYRKLPLDLVTEDLFNTVKELLVTDGKRYFRIVLPGSAAKAPAGLVE